MLVTYDPYSGTLGRFSRPDIIRMVAEAGYEGLNLPVREPFMNAEDEADVDEAVAQLGEHGLQVNTLTFGLNECTLPWKKQAVQDWLNVVLNVAAKLAANVVSIWPNLPEGESPEVAEATLHENMLAMIPVAAAAGCKIGLEFEKWSTIDNYRDGLAFIDNADPRLKLTADTYHLNNDGADMHAAVLAMKDRISDVHISGSHRGEPGSEGDTIDYDAFMRGLKEIGYAGDLVLQYHLEDPDSMRRACEFTKGLRAKME